MPLTPAPFDRANDRFLRPLVCPYAGCSEPAPVAPERSPEVVLCPLCLRPYELVTLEGDLDGADPWTARRPHAAFCTRSGRRLQSSTLLDWAEAGGGPGRGHAVRDVHGHLFGHASREVEWTFEMEWTQPRWGTDDRERPGEAVTSLSVHRGVVIAVSAKGRVALLRPEDGRPLLEHPIEWPGAEADDTLRPLAVRHPAALRSESICLVTEPRALFRDLSSALFGDSNASGHVVRRAEARSMFLGPPLVVDAHNVGVHPKGAAFVLLDGRPRSAHEPVADALLRMFSLAGEEMAKFDAPDIVRPPVFAPTLEKMVWVNHLGHAFLQGLTAPKLGNVEPVVHALPSTMLQLSPTERPLLVVAANNAREPELWLADDHSSHVRVWRAPLLRIEAGQDWSWEPVFEDEDLGALRGLAVGEGSGGEQNRAGLSFALTTDRAAALFGRALKTRDAEAVLAREAIAPPVLTHIGLLVQDRQGLWLRGLPPWNFKDDNHERLLLPDVPPVRPGLFEQTLAMLGRQVFFAVGGTICAARLQRLQRSRA